MVVLLPRVTCLGRWGGLVSQADGPFEGAEFVAEVVEHRVQVRHHPPAAGQPERDLVVGAGGGDVQALPVDRDGQRVQRVEAGAVPWLELPVGTINPTRPKTNL